MSSKKKSKELLKIILIFASVFILLPTIVFGILYFSNKNIRNNTNEFLRNFPGIVGEHFSKYPTKSEKEEMEKFLANYYLSIEEENSADKLYIIKKSDEELYNNVIKKMNQKSSSKTKNIILSIRNIELRKDLLHTLYDEIKQEQETALSGETKRVESLELDLAIKEIEIMAENSTKEELGKIFTNMKEDAAVNILYYLQPEIRDKIISSIDTQKQKEIKSLLLKKEKNEEELLRKSMVYEAMDAERAFSEISNSDIYNAEDLAKIFINLSIQKAADILLNSDDDFINGLIDEMEKIERITDIDELKTVKIMEAISFKREYNKKIAELVKTYERMEATDIAKIVEKMIANNSTITAFEIDENPVYTISDSSIIIDVLKNMKKQKVSQILGAMDADKAAVITRELAIK